MRIVLIGQQDFGKAALEAFLARGDEVVGVFCRPEKPGTKPDALRVEAQARGLQVFQLDKLTGDDAHQAMQALAPEADEVPRAHMVHCAMPVVAVDTATE